MREIKFRAWDNKSKRMIYAGDDFDYYICVNLSGAISVFDNEDGGKEGLWEHDVSSYVEIVLMQFTGLCDKNGKEIYEGDILSGHDDGTVKVEWLEASWGCVFIPDQSSSIGLDEMCIWFGNNSTVIGNIHENGELLKERE